MGATAKTVIVVGGGVAGIAASLALAKHGVQVQLLEARRRLGGRTGSFASIETNEQVDYCQHVGMGCCTNLRQLIDWLGQADQWSTHESLHFYGPTGRYQRLAALPLVPAPLHLASWLMRWPGLSTRDRIAVARGMLAIRKLVIDSSTDQLPAEPWLVAQAQTPNAIDRFWRTIIVSALGEELARVNLSAVAKVLQDGFLNHRNAFHLMVPNKPLGELFGTHAEAKLREAGVDVCLQTRVQQFTQTAERQFCVETEKNGQLKSGRDHRSCALVPVAEPRRCEWTYRASDNCSGGKANQFVADIGHSHMVGSSVARYSSCGNRWKIVSVGFSETLGKRNTRQREPTLLPDRCKCISSIAARKLSGTQAIDLRRPRSGVSKSARRSIAAPPSCDGSNVRVLCRCAQQCVAAQNRSAEFKHLASRRLGTNRMARNDGRGDLERMESGGECTCVVGNASKNCR